MPLHLDYRPTKWDEVYKNESTIKSLQGLVKNEKRQQAYLFFGNSGCGKTTMARLFLKSLGCSDIDILESNTADNRGIDSAREIIANAPFKPLNGKYKGVILDEVHQTSKDFQQALLKVVEEPPKHLYFILCTTDPEKIIPTLKNRCMAFQVESFTVLDIVHYLEGICEKEGLKIPALVLKKISQNSGGSLRKALIDLESIQSMSPEEMENPNFLNGTSVEKQSIDLCRILIQDRVTWTQVCEVLSQIKELDVNAEKIRWAVLGYATAVLLKSKDHQKAALVLECFKNNFYDSKKAGLVLACYQTILN